MPTRVSVRVGGQTKMFFTGEPVNALWRATLMKRPKGQWTSCRHAGQERTKGSVHSPPTTFLLGSSTRAMSAGRVRSANTGPGRTPARPRLASSGSGSRPARLRVSLRSGGAVG